MAESPLDLLTAEINLLHSLADLYLVNTPAKNAMIVRKCARRLSSILRTLERQDKADISLVNMAYRAVNRADTAVLEAQGEIEHLRQTIIEMEKMGR